MRKYFGKMVQNLYNYKRALFSVILKVQLQQCLTKPDRNLKNYDQKHTELHFNIITFKNQIIVLNNGQYNEF